MATNLVYKFQIIYKIHRDRMLPQKQKNKNKNSKRRQKVEMLVMKSSNKEM